MNDDLIIASFFALCWSVVLTGLHFSWEYALVLTGVILVTIFVGAGVFLVYRSENERKTSKGHSPHG